MKQKDYWFLCVNVVMGIFAQLILSYGFFYGVYIVGFPYLLALLLLPMTTPLVTQLLLGASVGLLIDMFYESLGVHMASCTALMYVRVHLISLFTPIALRERQLYQRIRYMGFTTYLLYLIAILLVHHLSVFTLESASFPTSSYRILNFLKSIILTALFFLLVEALHLLFSKKR